jgi:hypothetical protein
MSDTSRDPALLHPLIRTRWEYMAKAWGRLYPDLPWPFLTCTYRGPKDQDKALREGKSMVAFGGSLHNYRPAFAFDVAFQRNGKADWSFHLFEKMAGIGEPLGLEWGGRWEKLVDGPHFQLPMTWRDAAAGKLPALPPLPPGMTDLIGEGDVPDFKLVVISEPKQEQHVLEIPKNHHVVTRYDPDRRRYYVVIRRGGE